MKRRPLLDLAVLPFRVVLWLALGLAGGCYNPHFNNPTCPTGECPAGWTCVDGACVRDGDVEVDAADVDTPETDAPDIDAPVDAADVDALDAAVSDATDARTDAPTDARTDAPTDARTDAPTDAATDAPTDASTTGYVALISIVESQVLSAMSSGVNPIGQGVTIQATFAQNDGTLVYESVANSPLGCKVYVQDTASEISAAGGLDEGSVSVAVTGGNPPPTNPTFPSCRYGMTTPAGVPGYACIDQESSGSFPATGASLMNSMMTSFYILSVPGETFASEDVGRQIHIEGTNNASLDHRAWTIVAVPSATSLMIWMPSANTGNITAGTYTMFAGSGINASASNDPGQLGGDVTVTVTVDADTMGSGNHFGDFTGTITDVGDDFPIGTTTANRLRSIPFDGTSFSVNCTTGECGTADVMALILHTTDTSVSTTDPYVMPKATSKRVAIRCAELNATSITVPTVVSAYLQSSNATRVQASLIRASIATPTTRMGSSATVIAGHAYVGFTTRSP